MIPTVILLTISNQQIEALISVRVQALSPNDNVCGSELHKYLKYVLFPQMFCAVGLKRMWILHCSPENWWLTFLLWWGMWRYQHYEDKPS